MKVDLHTSNLIEEMTGTKGPTDPDFDDEPAMLSEEEEEEESNSERVVSKRAQIFSGSNEAWTDERIKEFNAAVEVRGIEKAKDDKPSSHHKKFQTVVNYETFESSSGEEMQNVMFESEALSFQNRDKKATSQEREAKRAERQKRKYRKIDERVRQVREERREQKKRKLIFLK